MRVKKSAVLLFIACSITMPATADNKAKNIYDRFIQSFDRNTPQSYSCRLSGSAIRDRLKRIPSDAVTTGKKPVVKLYHADHLGQVIKVKNVADVFENLFSMYNRYLSMTGSWIAGKGRSWKVFRSKYSIELLGLLQNSYIIKIVQQNSNGSGYAVFYINRRTMLIKRALFYYKKQIVYQVRNRYRMISRYTLPHRITITTYQNGIKQKSVVIILIDYRINIPVSEKLFSR